MKTTREMLEDDRKQVQILAAACALAAEMIRNQNPDLHYKLIFGSGYVQGMLMRLHSEVGAERPL